jgi:hypothetical protein
MVGRSRNEWFAKMGLMHAPNAFAARSKLLRTFPESVTNGSPSTPERYDFWKLAQTISYSGMSAISA